jgi:hypothetical protein
MELAMTFSQDVVVTSEVISGTIGSVALLPARIASFTHECGMHVLTAG